MCLVLAAILLGSLQWIRNSAFQPEFHFREHVEIAGGQFRSVGRVGNSGHVIFCQEFLHNERGVCRRIVMVQQPVSVLPHLRPFVLHIFPQSSQNLVVKLPIDSLTRWLLIGLGLW